MRVYEPGTKVTLADGAIDGVIQQVCISIRLHVTYLVVWWDMRSRKEELVEANEITPVGDVKPLGIGFHRQA